MYERESMWRSWSSVKMKIMFGCCLDIDGANGCCSCLTASIGDTRRDSEARKRHTSCLSAIFEPRDHQAAEQSKVGAM